MAAAVENARKDSSGSSDDLVGLAREVKVVDEAEVALIVETATVHAIGKRSHVVGGGDDVRVCLSPVSASELRLRGGR